ELFHKLKTAAIKASQFAYCPYSGFRVGAALETDGGEIFSGCNVENASFGLVICAERNAVFQAVAKKGKFTLRAVLIYTHTQKPSPPCGSCRQVLNEFGPEAEVICICDGPEIIRKNLMELFPDPFGPKVLHHFKKP